MCTVTVIQLADGGYRLVTSRDESPDRPRATPPRWRDRVAGDARAIWPIDGLAGGTWVAAGEHGLALTLLNGNLRDPGPRPSEDRRLSRGGIIPRLIGLADAGKATEALGRLELERFEPFRLVAMDAGAGTGESVRIIESLWDGRSLSTVALGAGPACFASSGLGDWLAQPRLPLFEELVVDAGPTPAAQDEFHEHRWPDRPEISVLMERGDARTVSITRVHVRPGRRGRFEVSMDHETIGAEPVCRGG